MVQTNIINFAWLDISKCNYDYLKRVIHIFVRLPGKLGNGFEIPSVYIVRQESCSSKEDLLINSSSNA